MLGLKASDSAVVSARLSASVIDKAKGCIIGALLGDATGAPLEFTHDLSKEKIQDAMELKGGGVFRVAPGQVTDDGELSMCVLNGLAKCKLGYDPNVICLEYGRWISSNPFDIGTTTRTALTEARKAGPELSKRVSKAALEMAHSISNGSTMKLSPTAAYGSFLPLEKMLEVVETETRHVHQNQNVLDCNIGFALAIRTLIHGGTPEQAYAAQAEFIKISSIADWLRELEEGNLQPPNRKIGWVKIAYQQAFLHLRKKTPFSDALRAVVSQGGDTDTNVCIVGMLLGARDGLSNLDQNLVGKLLSCNTNLGQPRPEFLHTNLGIHSLIDQMLENALIFADNLAIPTAK